MAQSLALNQQGAVPQMSINKPNQISLAPKPTYTPPSGGPKLATNPMGNPSTGLIGSINKATGLSPQPSPSANMSVAPKVGTNPGMIPSPTTPLKKTTTTNVDGSSVTHEYHAEAKPETKTVTSPQTEQKPPVAQNTYAPGNTSQAGFIGNVAQSGQSTPEENYWKDQYQKSVAGTQFGKLAPYAEAGMNVGKTPEQLQGLITAPDLAGRSSGDSGLYNALGSAYGNAALAGLSAAQTDAARNLTANTSAANLSAPTSQFGMLTNQQTGQIVGGQGSTASGVMSSALQNALKMIQSGQTSYQDAYNTSGLSAFGVLGQTALQNALNSGGSTFSPTTNATEVGTNQSNLADTQKQAYNLNQNLQQVEKISPILTTFLQGSGVNPFDAQMYNGPVNDYLKQIGNSGAATQWAAQMGELKNFTSQILATGYGGTPTGAEAATLSQDPSNLSYSALQAYLQTLRDLGGNRLSTLQDNIKNLGGSGVGYTGSPASTVTSTAPATPAKGELGSGVTSPIGMLTAGLALDKIPDALEGAGKAVASGIGAGAGSKVLSYILAP